MDTNTDTNTQNDTQAPAKVGRKPKLSDKQVAYAARLYESGKSIESIAKYANFGGVSPATIRSSLLARTDVEMRRRGRPGMSQVQVARAVELHGEGLTLAEIREHEDLSAGKGKMFSLPTLSRALKAEGCELKRGRPAKVEEPEAEVEADEVEAEAVAAE